MRDFENILNLDELDAVAVEAVVWQELSEEPALDADRLEVHVTDGRVRVDGRVGSDREHAKVVHVVANLLDPERFDDAVLVDEALRGLRPDPEGDLYATHDAGAAAGKAQPYNPPSAQVREEDGDEQH